MIIERLRTGFLVMVLLILGQIGLQAQSSSDGLKGIRSVHVQIEAIGLGGDTVATRDLIELRLRGSGLRVLSSASSGEPDAVLDLYMISSGDEGDRYVFASFDFAIYRNVFLAPRTGMKAIEAIVWRSRFVGVTDWSKLRPTLDSQMDHFLNAWTEVNSSR
jgi:hypothetical protein